MRVVVTMSTIPTREDSLFKTIKSIQEGTCKPDVIYVNLPDWYPRFNRAPDPTLEQKLIDAGVTVNKTKDYGVLTSVLAIMDIETDPDTLIVFINDDANYKPRFLEGLLKGYAEFKCPVGYSGLAYPETTLRVWGRIDYGVLLGHGNDAEIFESAFGYLFPRSAVEGFPRLAPMSLPVQPEYLSDDYLFPKYFEHKGLPKKVVCYPWAGRHGDDWSTVWTQNENSQTYSLSRDGNNLLNFLNAGKRIKF